MHFRRLFLGAAAVQLILLPMYWYFVPDVLTIHIGDPAANHTVPFYQDNTVIDIHGVHLSGSMQLPSDAEMDAFVSNLPKQRFLGKKKQCELNRCLIFMHIAKAGGSSFEKVAARIANETGRTFHGFCHFDWSTIEAVGGGDGTNHADVLLFLREPVDRALSHFYFLQTIPWGKALFGENKTSLTSYLHNKSLMLDSRDIWQDGQAAVSWLSGTHIAKWVGTPERQIHKRELIASTNFTLLMHLAANRLERTRWFGILGREYLNRSMELLQHAMQLNYRPKMPRNNVGKVRHGKPSASELAALASLMPQDIWLFDYATHLFEARWEAYQTGKGVQLPQRPPLPEMTCTSTRFNLTCNSGPLKGI